MNVDFNMITAFMAIISSLIAIYAVINESKRSGFSLRIDLLFKINDQFNSLEFTLKRKNAAKLILNLKDKKDYSKWVGSELDDILDFFQSISSLTERKALDVIIVWEYFSYWLNNYYELSKEYIIFTQKEYPQTWEGVEALHKMFVKIENKEYRVTKRKYTPPSQAEILRFLKNESKLRIKSG